MTTVSEEIMDKLCECGHDVYIVGGAVRDLLLSKKPKDDDIVTSATPEEIEELFQNERSVKKVGKSFSVIMVDGVDVATYRHDRYSGLSDKKVEVSFADSIQEDLGRRDLTINSMAFCQYTGEIIDLFDGRKDLKDKVIRFSGDPEKRIFEDPNRILRACRFKAVIEGTFAPETKNALIKFAHYIRDYVAPERIRVEILKSMGAKKPSIFFEALHEIGALKFVFPSLNACFAHPHGSFHKEDIFEHNMICGDNVSPRCALTRLSAFLHDVGKPITAETSTEGELHFLDHEKVGAKVLADELRNLSFFKAEIKVICELVELHMRSFATPKATRRFLKRADELEVSYRSFLRLRLADRKANTSRKCFAVSEVREILKSIENARHVNVPTKIAGLPINGNDVVRVLDVKPGPIVGQILRHFLQMVTDDPQVNKRSVLLELLKTVSLKEFPNAKKRTTD